MRLYLDLNCFNRPFDDQSQARIRRETEAILAILARIVERTDSLVWSWALDWENARHPIADRREEISLWRQHTGQMIELTPAVEESTRKIHGSGIAALDAAHLACAGAAGIDVFLTRDDMLESRARELGVALPGPDSISLPFRTMNPLEYWQEVREDGRAVDRE